MSIGGIIVFVIAFGCSWGPIVWLYNAEILTDKANSLAAMINWFANLVITVAAPTIHQHLDYSQAGYIFIGAGCFMFIATIYTCIFMKETMNKTQVEIEAMFCKVPKITE